MPERRFGVIGLYVAWAFVAGATDALASDAWQFRASPVVGGDGSIPAVNYVGPLNRGFNLMVECRGSGPSVYITVSSPDPDLRQFRFDTPIRVKFRLEPPLSKSPFATETHVTATLSEGYIAHTDRIRLGIGLQDGAAVTDLLGRDTGSDITRVIVEIEKTSASFVMAGAHVAFAQLKRSCDAQSR